MQPPATNPSQTSMENCRRKRSSSGGGGGGGSFSFPSTPIHDGSSSSSYSSSDDFEFGSCLTPDSPSGGGIDPNKSSPADHLFFNGRLLPHSFPFRPPPPTPLPTLATNPDLNSRPAPSRTSSIGSKDSLLSSRSNSTSSRSSSCSSSARTSTSAASSDGSERRLLLYGRQGSKSAAAASTGKAVSAQVYGSSQRWQFMAPVPALSRETSRRRKAAAAMAAAAEAEPRRTSPKKKNKKKAVVKRSRSRRFGRRLFRWFVSACKECHAIEPSRKKDKILRKNVN